MGTRRSQASSVASAWTEDSGSFGELSAKDRRVLSRVEGSACPAPTVTHVTEDLTPNAEVASRRNAISDAHGAVVLNQSENVKL